MPSAVFRVKKVKAGNTKSGRPYIFVSIGDGVGGFVSKDAMSHFEGVQVGDEVEFDIYNFREGDDKGIKLIPRVVYPAASR